MGANADIFGGDHLFGDDLDDDQIRQWFADEEHGYFDLTSGVAQKIAEYDALNEIALFSHIKRMRFDTCLALGCARGNDIAPLAPLVNQFIAIEPSTEFWRDIINQKPAHYRKPTLRGLLNLADGSVDIATAISVLHHIPNVTEVLTEIHRVLRPGGVLVMREPIVSMGDWRAPRRGLTKNERGIPHKWLLNTLKSAGFGVEHATYFAFAPMQQLARWLKIMPYRNAWTTYLDLLLSAATIWNVQYHRTRLIQKIAPSAVAIVASKMGTP